MISYMISCVLGRYQGYQETWSFMFHVHDIIIWYHVFYDIIYDIMLLDHDIMIWHINMISCSTYDIMELWYHNFLWYHSMISLCDLNCLNIRWTCQTSLWLTCTGGRYVHGASWFPGLWWWLLPQSAGSLPPSLNLNINLFHGCTPHTARRVSSTRALLYGCRGSG